MYKHFLSSGSQLMFGLVLLDVFLLSFGISVSDTCLLFMSHTVIIAEIQLNTAELSTEPS